MTSTRDLIEEARKRADSIERQMDAPRGYAYAERGDAAKMRALCDALEEATAWKPIESAPKDGHATFEPLYWRPVRS